MLIVVTVVVGLSIGAWATANEPKQADIDTCNKVAASAAESLDVSRNAETQPTPAQSNRSGNIVDDRHPAAPATRDAPESHGSASAREAFAACFAQHGYYKGYYR